MPGTSISYTIVVTNAGPSAATNVVVADTFPATLTDVTWTSVRTTGVRGNNAGSGTINDTIDFIPAGGTVTFTVTATIDPAATGTLSNTATVSRGRRHQHANNSATDTTDPDVQYDLSITKTDGQTTDVPGTTTTYTIVVTNAGPSAATNVVVADTFPATLTGVTWTSVGSAGVTGNDASRQRQHQRHRQLHPGRRHGHLHRDGHHRPGRHRHAGQHGHGHPPAGPTDPTRPTTAPPTPPPWTSSTT